SDQDLYLQASALQANQQNIILIQSLAQEYHELFSYIQQGRENTLSFIDERKQSQEKVLKTTFYDLLTGLPNQTYFLIELAHAFERQKQQGGQPFAVLIINIDRFQSVNNSFGRLAGDQLLITIAWRLKNYLGQSELFARLGGDEFIVLLDDIESIGAALLAANQVLAQMKKPFSLNGQELFMTASIGIALTQMNYERAEDLFRDANTAMYYAKGLGRSHSVAFDQRMHVRAVRLLQLEHDLKRALQEQELNLLYQPVISLNEKKIIGFEALIRWIHPVYGLVSPLEFIPIAEETGLIIAIDQWILREACFKIQQWRQFVETPLTISVNFSAQQFEQTDLVSQVKQVLRETGITPHHLMIEITESALFSKANRAVTTLKDLKDIGVRLCIDDFGTGYASLSYLQQLPIDTLKIDRSFIKNLDHNNRDLVGSIITLARDLDLHLTAEGVETIEQYQYLMELGCENAQGHLFAQPMNSQNAVELLRCKSVSIVPNMNDLV
ncbi:MAG: bifunctional diguanylate cyclase/phosphodiesterase, partial [Acaryochloridaceae cyanobacterium CSU_5_19]|nr:bifunctional diguanylate cyclase/phosphodiesterase [Acaryochloridaceae cyanobacterium CSU_5_19]